MKLDNARVLTFRHPNMGEVVAISNGGESIDDARYLMSIQEHPYDDQETMVYKSTIAYLMEENKWLKKQVRKLKVENY